MFSYAQVCVNREDRIRTCDPLVPNQVLYQAELLPENDDPFIRGGSNLYHILRTNVITRVLFFCQSRNDEVLFGLKQENSAKISVLVLPQYVVPVNYKVRLSFI